jgi:hypothetical protein
VKHSLRSERSSILSFNNSRSNRIDSDAAKRNRFCQRSGARQRQNGCACLLVDVDHLAFVKVEIRWMLT